MKITLISTTYDKMNNAYNILECYPDLRKFNPVIDCNEVLIVNVNSMEELKLINKITDHEIIFDSNVKIFDAEWNYVEYENVIEIYDEFRE